MNELEGDHIVRDLSKEIYFYWSKMRFDLYLRSIWSLEWRLKITVFIVKVNRTRTKNWFYRSKVHLTMKKQSIDLFFDSLIQYIEFELNRSIELYFLDYFKIVIFSIHLNHWFWNYWSSFLVQSLIIHNCSDH